MLQPAGAKETRKRVKWPDYACGFMIAMVVGVYPALPFQRERDSHLELCSIAGIVLPGSDFSTSIHMHSVGGYNHHPLLILVELVVMWFCRWLAQQGFTAAPR